MTLAVTHRLSQFRLATMFLTRLPVGRLNEPVPSLSEARWAFPFVGLLVGLLGWLGQHVALELGLAVLPAAFVALAVIVVVTGGLHHDGLADFADGMGGGRDADHCLEVMRDSRIGSYGVLALIFAAALTGTAMASFDAGAPVLVFLFIGVASRLAMLIALDMLPPARSEGLGQTASGAPSGAWIPGLAALVLIGLVGDISIWLLLIGIALAWAGCSVLAKRRIGGQTGDVLGAVQLSSEVLAWLLAAAWLAS